jgi:hypothetical protein
MRSPNTYKALPKRYPHNKCPHQHPLDRHLKILSSKGRKNQIFSDYITFQFDCVFEPLYFGTICWHPFVFLFEEAENEARHFKNKLLSSTYQCRPCQIPDLPDRCRIIFMQEVKEALVNPNSSNPKYKKIYNTHFHLEGTENIRGLPHLNSIIQFQVRPKFGRLLRPDTESNSAVVVKPWQREFHATYNVKDYYTNQFLQDGDLVLDYKNSDLG